MTNRERVLEALEASGGGLCDECITKLTGISRHQTVQQVCARLANEYTSREHTACSGCGKNVLVNKLHRKTERPLPIPLLADGTQSWFDEMRAQLVRALNQLDPQGKGEPFSRRVASLRDEGRLQRNAASWMLTWTSLRNIVAFEGHVLTARELEIVRLVRDELTAWLTGFASENDTHGHQT